MDSLTVHLPASAPLTDDQFYDLCRANPDLRIERNANGELVFMSPTGGETGKRNAKLTARFVIWSEQANLGEVFDSSTCFKLPNGAERSPDVAWVRQDRWDALTPEQKEKFPPIAPDFVLELMSPSDTLEATQAKMREYIENGVKLGWLVNRRDRQVEIYRAGQAVETLQAPGRLSGETILSNFTLNLEWFW
ncbi:Uma2 family endonuclease [Leptolyngbya ohadii]|uniref:Uma2 family endonuclease n=1 Tax=Leptolyngbya ohadii TaxID=1962290 RepID=UPI000B59B606|nr:Uma2 family endonuclease [Leptolyngbya ohadii]